VRKGTLFALMMTPLLLAGCSMGEENKEEPLPVFCAAEMEAEVLCHCGDELRSYTLTCNWTPETAEVTVLAPETSAGLTARWDGEALTLAYDDLILDAGPWSGTDLSPAMVLPSMASAMRSGYPLERGREDIGETPCLRVTYETDEGDTLYSIWYTAEKSPLRCEVERDGVLLFEVSVTDFRGEEEGEQTDEVQPETNLGGDRSGRPGT